MDTISVSSMEDLITGGCIVASPVCSRLGSWESLGIIDSQLKLLVTGSLNVNLQVVKVVNIFKSFHL